MTSTETESTTSAPILVRSGAPILERLDGTVNYNNWKFAMKMSLILDGLWNCVLATNTDSNKDQMALAKICLNVQSSCYAHVRNARTSKEAWDNLQTAFENKGLCRRLGLLRRLLRTKYEDFNSMGEYVSGLISLVQQLADIDHIVDDEEVAMLLLGGLPTEFDPLVMGIEATHTTISSEMVKTRLLQEDYRRTETEGASSSETALAIKSRNISSKKRVIICHNCHEEGHIKPRCPRLKKESKQNKKIYHGKQDQRNFAKKTNESLLLTTALASTVFSDTEWYIDSGCTTHMSKHKDWFANFSSDESKEVTVANNQKITSSGTGNVKVKLKDNAERTITEVMYVPHVAANLLSVNKITEKGLICVFDNEKCSVYNQIDCKIQGQCKVSASNIGGVYRLDQAVESPSKMQDEHVAALITAVSQEVWHRRLGHLSQKSMSMLKNGLATGIYFQDKKEPIKCVPCIEGKQTRNSFPKGMAKRAREKLELIHSDLCGPMSEPSWGGARYLLTFTDDYSRKSFGYLLKSKYQVFHTFTQFKSLVENQLDLKIKKLRTDNGKEYCNKIFEEFLIEHGIIHETTVPYTPQQNGVSERLNRTLVEKTRSMLQDSGLGIRYWGEAVSTAIYLKNRSPTVAVVDATPEEIWSNFKVDLSNLRVFGCTAYAHIPHELRKKLDPKSKKYIMVGYCEHTKGYRLVDPEQPGKVVKARNVIFIESTPNEIPVRNVPVIDFNNTVDMIEVHAESENVDEHSGEDLSSDEIESKEEDSSSSADEEIKNVPIESVDETQRRERRKPKWMDDYDVSYQACIELSDEPQTVQEALSSPQKEEWEKAMNEEYRSMIEKEVWELVDRPKDQNVVKCKWVFKIKRNAAGNFERFKARLVARGYSQRHGIDFDETFSPVVRHSTMRLLFCLGNEMDMDIDHLDITTAFLNGELTETIFMEQPTGFDIEGSNKVCLLKKSIYGLKQASRAWNQTVHKLLSDAGYVQSKCEQCVYIKKSKDVLVVIALYVDDFFVFSNCENEKIKLVNALKEKFELKFLGPVTNCLGMKVVRDRQKGTLSLCQSHYVKCLLTRFGMSEAKPVKTPMAVNVKLEKPDESNAVNNSIFPYQQLIGGLMYLAVCTRPDIAYTTSALSQFNTCHDSVHWCAAKRVLRYLAGTTDYGLMFEKTGKSIEAFADADWAGDIIDRKSYTGFVMKFGNCAVSWESRKQKTVALSSTEAEYLALSDVTKEACFLRSILTELCGKTETIEIFNDNQSAHKILNNSQHHRRTKHIDVRHHYVREAVKEGIIIVKYRPTNDMVADVLTKALPINKHKMYTEGLGVKQIKDI